MLQSPRLFFEDGFRSLTQDVAAPRGGLESAIQEPQHLLLQIQQQALSTPQQMAEPSQRLELQYTFRLTSLELQSAAHIDENSADESVVSLSTHESMPPLVASYTTGSDIDQSSDTTASDELTLVLALQRLPTEPSVSDDDNESWSPVADDWSSRARSNSSDASGYADLEYDFLPDVEQEHGESESGAAATVVVPNVAALNVS